MIRRFSAAVLAVAAFGAVLLGAGTAQAATARPATCGSAQHFCVGF